MYNNSLKEIYNNLKTSPHGLTNQEALSRLKAYGKNKLIEQKRDSFFVRFLKQFKDVLILILLVAASISIAISLIEKSYSELFDGGLILTIVIINAIIGVIQQNKADKAMLALKNLTKPFAKVIRDGQTIKVKTEDIVIGDIVVLESGDIVPADLRLIETASLKIEESAITGESVASEKNIETITLQNVVLGDQLNMAFMGTQVNYGRGMGVVVSTGMQTQMGKIAHLITEIKDDDTPLTKRINKTSKVLSIIILLIAVFILVSAIVQGDSFIHAFMLAAAIAVGAIPEGLPTALTVTLSIGVQEMSKKKAIVKNLPAVETLGSTQVICSDKTGTLTLNKMTVKQVYFKNSHTLNSSVNNPTITKNTNNNANLKKSNNNTLPVQDLNSISKNKNFTHLINCMLLCNDTQQKFENNILKTLGDPTETALVHYGFENNINKEKLDGTFARVNEIPFDSERKLMTTLHDKSSDGELISYTKGAIESILPRCSQILDNGKIRKITSADIAEIESANHLFGQNALRVLGFSFKNVSATQKITSSNIHQLETNLVFVGLAGLIDPPRPEVYEAIQTCKEAGILPIMITGDHKDTAFAIAKELGIAVKTSQVITGAELNKLSDKQLKKLVTKFTVYARVNPEHKVKIVNAFKQNGLVVAMTGDGVNDAPSLKIADIGIGMGISGTDVTKGVADIILTDDNFATIVSAVKEGRRVYKNILKILQFLLTTSIAEVILIIVIMSILGKPFFSPALILYINFVTDSLIALALGAEKSEPHIMKEKPNSNNSNLMVSKMGFNIFYMSVVQSVLIFTLYFLSLNVWGYSILTTITMCFIALACMELFHAYNLKSEKSSVFKVGIFNNKFLNYAFLISFALTTIVVLVPISAVHTALGITNLNAVQWLISIGFAVSIIPVIEFIKIIIRHFQNKPIKVKTKGVN